jgi:hypothetical protein
MRLDEDEPVTGKSRGRNKSLNLKGQAFIGGWSFSPFISITPGCVTYVIRVWDDLANLMSDDPG